MSYTELHTGKLRFVGKVDKYWVEENLPHLKWNDGYGFEINRNFNTLHKNVDITHVHYKGELYELINHVSHDDAEFLHETQKNLDNTISFTYLFYNGGTCFEEMLEEGLESLDK